MGTTREKHCADLVAGLQYLSSFIDAKLGISHLTTSCDHGGQVAMGEVAKGEVAMGEVAKAEVAMGEVTMGEVAMGEVAMGEVAKAL